MTTIAFATLFLGLVLGPQQIELVVEGSPAAVQLVLDGREVASLSKPPWRAQIDLGSRLTPHVLEAIARDAQGAVLGSASQWINLPRAAAEAALVLETDSWVRSNRLTVDERPGSGTRTLIPGQGPRGGGVFVTDSAARTPCLSNRGIVPVFSATDCRGACAV